MWKVWQVALLLLGAAICNRSFAASFQGTYIFHSSAVIPFYDKTLLIGDEVAGMFICSSWPRLETGNFRIGYRSTFNSDFQRLPLSKEANDVICVRDENLLLRIGRDRFLQVTIENGQVTKLGF